MKSHWINPIRYGLLVAMFLAMIFTAHAQDTRPLTLDAEDNTIEIEVPDAWMDAEDPPANTAEALSAESLFDPNLNVQHVRLSINTLSASFGELPADAPFETYMKLLQASLPINGDFQPEHFSEIRAFRWNQYEAVVFLAYAKAGYYARWFGVKLDDDHVLLITQGTTFPPDSTPLENTFAQFDAMLGAITINGDTLDSSHLKSILDTLSNPLAARDPIVAAMRVTGGTEIRMAAPQDWFRQDVTRTYPVQYFFQNDPRQLDEGDRLAGAVIQVSLLDADALRRKLDLEQLPAAQEIAISYFNTMLADAPAATILGTPIEAALTDTLYAVLVPAELPSPVALHSGGTIEQVLAVEIGEDLLVVSLYAPQDAWDSILPIWKNILSSLIINGEPVPMDSLLSELD